MTEKRPKGVSFWAWSLILTSLLQFASIAGTFKEFSFLPRWGTLLIALYLVIFYLGELVAGINLLALKSWAHRLIMWVVWVGLADRVLFVPLRYASIEHIPAQPATSKMFLDQYKIVLTAVNPDLQISDQALLVRIVHDLHQIQLGIEACWLVFLLSLLFFFTRPSVKAAFDR